MFRVNALFEAWLRDATEKPLASWKRAALLWRLQEDEDLRCYAAELAQFSHEPEPAKGLSAAEQAWMRERLRAHLDTAKPAAADGWLAGWTGPALGLGLGLLVLGAVLFLPKQDPESVSQGASGAQAEALALPTATMTVTPSITSDAKGDELKDLHAGPPPTMVH